MTTLNAPSKHVVMCSCRCRCNLAFTVCTQAVPSVSDSVAAFNKHVQPLELTQRKYQTHRLNILTWAVWKKVLQDLLPMSDELLLAFIWDALVFEALLPVLKHSVDAIKA